MDTLFSFLFQETDLGQTGVLIAALVWIANRAVAVMGTALVTNRAAESQNDQAQHTSLQEAIKLAANVSLYVDAATKALEGLTDRIGLNHQSTLARLDAVAARNFDALQVGFSNTGQGLRDIQASTDSIAQAVDAISTRISTQHEALSVKIGEVGGQFVELINELRTNAEKNRQDLAALREIATHENRESEPLVSGESGELRIVREDAAASE